MIRNILSLLSNPTYAAGAGDPPPQIGDLAATVGNLTDYIFPVGALICVAMIIYGGYMWVISGGDPGKKQTAQGTLTWAVLGLVFLFLIRAILSLVVTVIS